MSSLIEQAAKRLAQLRKAGAEVPDSVPEQAAAEGPKDHIMEAARIAAARREPFIAVENEGMATGTDTDKITAAAATRAAALNAYQRQNRPQSRPHSQRVELNLEAIAAAGMVSPNAPGSWIADQYRVIKRPLLANAAGKGAMGAILHGNMIMVTSALPGEGKTFNAVNLAMSIATELDHTVMLVDADVAQPSLLQLLGLEPPQHGLLDLLQDDSLSVSDVLLRTNVDKLSILPSGTPHPKATELLASDAMARLVRDIAGRYEDRIIIFDSPPLLPTTESHVLATQMGQIVMVIEAERTLQNEVSQALSLIEACPVKLMILNKAKVEFKSGYSYGYGYALGYG